MGHIYACFRLAFLVLIWPIIIALPNYFFPLINGSIEGFFIGERMMSYIFDAQLFTKDLAGSQWRFGRLTYQGGPGTPASPFHLPEIRNPLGWWQQLGLERFDLDQSSYTKRGVPHPNVLVQTDVFWRKRQESERSGSWNHWIYFSSQDPNLENLANEWDEAFDKLMQYRYANPSPSPGGFHFVSCFERWICRALFIEGPALLYLTTESWGKGPFGEMGMLLNATGWEAVSVHIINLPVQLGVPGVFPSHFNQLRDLTQRHSIWSEKERFSNTDQTWHTMQPFLKEKERTRPYTYGLLMKLERLWHRIGLGRYDSRDFRKVVAGKTAIIQALITGLPKTPAK